MSTVVELRKLASAKGIKGRSSMNKAQLMKALKMGSSKGSRKGSAKGKKAPPAQRGPAKGSAKGSPAKDRPFTVYTKEGCPYCAKAKELLKRKGFKFTVKVLNDRNREATFKKIDGVTNGYRYYPIIIRGGKFIGGYSELEKLYG